MAQTAPKPKAPNLYLFKLTPPAASGFGISISCLVLTGWALNLSTLRSVIPGQPQMVPITAITFILASICLWTLWREKKPQRASVTTWICALAVIAVGLLTLAEYLTSADLGLDSFLFKERLR